VLRILGRANSFNVRKVLWICGELDIPFMREDWGRGFKPTSDPEFLKRSTRSG
jgi:glutathione S-transferase